MRTATTAIAAFGVPQIVWQHGNPATATATTTATATARTTTRRVCSRAQWTLIVVCIK